MKIGIVGGGTVGRALARAYVEFVDEVRVYDVVPELATTQRLGDALRCDVVFVCLPEDVIEQFVKSSFTICGGLVPQVNFVLKSTVPIGTTRRLRDKYGLTNLVHSPEFLTGRCADLDARIPSVNIIGYPDPRDGPPNIYFLYQRRFPGTPIRSMSSDESEFVKLALNSTFAVKVAWFNELRCYADALGIDWETVRAGMLADGRITAHHTLVPGPDGKRGFGGKCLPKDLQHLIQGMYERDLCRFIAEAARTRNNLFDRKEGGGK